jgi:acyl phosphate:glycerol-3-phosphate acyltransferase
MNAPLLLTAIGGYLLGSIPFGVVLTRMAGLGDIRTIGSGNIGATNVLRTGKKGLALATLLLDGGKGAVAVLIAKRCGTDAALVAAVASVLGHIFPIWLKFKGGKGVATALGVYLALSPTMGSGALIAWLLAVGITRTSSVGGIVSVVAGPAVALTLHSPRVTIATALIAALVVFRHHENIRRLISGTEPKIGVKNS